MLELRSVYKRYSGIPAVENVSFTARAGEVTGYLGANGSGKSTTMKMITGLIDMDVGGILFEGREIQHDLMAYKSRIGYLPEEPQPTRTSAALNTWSWWPNFVGCRKKKSQRINRRTPPPAGTA